ncbi:MAG TPA: hypothetical protein VGO59_18670 [Verrucomicrobiae bacterium]
MNASPYASGVTNNSGTIQYYLNSATPGMVVTVTTYPSGGHPALTPAMPAQGLNSFPLGGDTSYSISVFAVGSGAPALETIAPANVGNTNWSSPDPRGIAVDTTPTNGSTFGAVYVASSASGTGHGKGLFAFNSDMSYAFGTTSTGAYGTTWTAGGTSGPFKLSVSAYDGSVYANDETAANANVWQCDPYLRSAIAPVQVLAGLGANVPIHGQEYGRSVATGTLAGGNLVLYTFDITMPSVVSNSLGGSQGAIGAFAPGVNYFNSTLEWSAANPTAQITAPPGSAGGPSYNCIYRYTIGSGPLPWNNPPDLCVAEGLNIAGLVGDQDVAPDGKLFTVAERTNPGSAPYLDVFDSTGLTNLFCSATSTTDDEVQDQIYAAGQGSGLAAPYSVKVSPDDKYVAIYGIWGYIAIYTLTNGVPDVSTFEFIANGPDAQDGREIAWDAGDNIYALSSGTGALNIYDIGATSTCVTSNDATGLNGSFSRIVPNVSASVTAPTPLASQQGGSFGYPVPQPATFTVTLNAAQSSPVSIFYTLTGTGTNGVNYNASVNGVNVPASSTYTLVFPTGVTNEDVVITPTGNPVSGPSLSVIFGLKGNSTYATAAPASATASIANTGPQVILAGAATDPTMYRGTPGDYAGFQVIRWGDTNVTWTIPSTAFSYSGKAVEGVDYTIAVSNMTIDAGSNSVLATVGGPVSSAYPFTYVGNESIIVTMSGGTSPESIPFTVGSTSSATLTLLDNANPPETILWSDSLTNSGDTNWNLAFGSVATGTAADPTPTFIPNYLTIAGGGSDAAHDFDVEFGFPLANDPLIAQLPPNGASSALKVTVNKLGGVTYNNGSATISGATGGVSLYPAQANGVPYSFSGNYALRFSELSYEDSGSFATEYTQWGLDHYGTNANWWAGAYSGGAGNTNIDGIWYSLSSDQGGAAFGDVLSFTAFQDTFPNAGWSNIGNKSWASFATVFKHPPYNSTGTGSFAVGNGNFGNLWNDVELKQFNNVVTLSINKTVIFSFANTNIFKSGDVMLGYGDPFDSIGANGEAYFSNVRVVSLGAPAITGVTSSNGNLVITFTSPDADATPASFAVMSTTDLTKPFSTTAPSTITQSGDTFTAVTASSASGSKYFRIKQVNAAQ